MHIYVIIMARHSRFQIDVIFGSRYKVDEVKSSDAS